MRKLLLLAIFLISSIILHAQPGDPGGGGKPGGEVPISGIEVLLAIGIGLGIRSLTRSKKNNP